MKIDVLLGIIASIAMALAGFSLKWAFDANARIQVLEERLEASRSEHRQDDEQDRELRMLWKYTAWLHGQIDVLRFKAGLEPATKPLLD